VEGSGWPELWRSLRHPVDFFRGLGDRIRDDDIATNAAALAYYFFLSIFPLVLFVLALATLLPIHGLEAWLLQSAQESLPGEAYSLVEGTVRGLLAKPRSGLLSIGAGLALWTASSAFGGISNGLNKAYRVRDQRPWWRVRAYAMGLTIGLSVFMIVAFLLTLFGSQLVALIGATFGPLAAEVAVIVRWFVTIGAVTVVVAAMYYACPAVDTDWRWIRPGAVLFMLGFAGSSWAFSYYVGNFGSYDKTYGSLGAVIILLLWLYILALFLLLGGELNAVLDHHRTPPAREAVSEGGRGSAAR
jgi:membrane protein